MIKREALPKGETIENIFWSKRHRVERQYEDAKEKLRGDEHKINAIITNLKDEGITLVEHNFVNRISGEYSIDIYKLMENQCKELKRPWFKCVRTNYRRIIVNHIGTGPARGLLTPMLLIAEPVKQATKYVNKKHSWQSTQEPVDPNFIEDTFITHSDAAIRHWVTSRSTTILFQDEEGHRAFLNWRNQCLSTPLNRMLLGIHQWTRS